MADSSDTQLPDPFEPRDPPGLDGSVGASSIHAGSREPLLADTFRATEASRPVLFDWQNSFRILRRRRWPALTVMALAMVGAVLQASTRVPIYEAKVRLFLEEQRTSITGLKDLKELIDEQSSSGADFQTQFTILQSRSLARRSMQALGIWDDPVAREAAKPAPPADSFGPLVSTVTSAVGDFVSWVQGGAGSRVQEAAEPTPPAAGS